MPLLKLLSLVGSKRVLLENQNRRSKHDALAEKIELPDCNPTYASVLLPDGREHPISLRNLPSVTRDECTVVPDPISTLGSHLLPSNSDQSITDDNLTHVSHNPDVDKH